MSPDSASRTVEIAPSLMCADQTALAEEVALLAEVGVDWLHLDVMDAHFAPNMPMGLGALADLRSKTKIPFDVHLMVKDNDWFVGQIAEIGAEQIAVHYESAMHLDRTLAMIQDRGIKAGVALNPATPLEALDYTIERLDFVLLMTVNPGFAGQKMVPSAIRKIAACRDYLAEKGADVPISVDGNVSYANIPDMVAAGADILVAGTSSLYSRDGSRAENMKRTQEVVAEGLARRSE